MARTRASIGLMTTLVAFLLALAPTTALGQGTPEELLKARGLTRVGATFVIDADAKLPERLRKMRAAKRQLEEHARKRQRLEADVRKADTALIKWMREYTELKGRLRPSMSAREHNALADEINARVRGIKEAERFKEDKEKELKNLVEPRDDYVSSLLELSDSMEIAAREYEQLAKDPEVAGAIDKFNATAKPKAKLGPSAQFAAELKPIRQMRQMLDASSIPLAMGGGVPHVDVVLNGTVTQRMVLDSGAGLITITTALADQLGMKPGKDDESVTLVLADGRKTQAKLMKIKRVRVGQFTVEDAECAVLPAEIKGDNNLLGGTFLENFVYRMDLRGGRLHLSQVGGKPKTPDKLDAVATEKNPPAALPGAATAPAQAPRARNDPSGAGAGAGTGGTDGTDATGGTVGSTRPRPASPASQPARQLASDEGVELLGTMTGDTTRKEEGAIVLNDGERIESPEKYNAPVSFRIVAQTNSTDLRIGAMADQIIFNWRDNPKELRIDGGPAGGRHKPDAGQIPPNQWVNVRIDVTPKEMLIFVDGERRHRVQANFSRVNRPLVIFPAVGSTIKVKSVRVVQK